MMVLLVTPVTVLTDEVDSEVILMIGRTVVEELPPEPLDGSGGDELV